MERKMSKWERAARAADELRRAGQPKWLMWVYVAFGALFLCLLWCVKTGVLPDR